MQMSTRVELVLFAGGIALLSFCAAAFIGGHIDSRIAIDKFQLHATAHSITNNTPADTSRPDFSLWDQKRVREYQTSLAGHVEVPEAVLRIDKIHLVVPVLNGTDELTLNRGVGRIIGTAHIGAPGNLGIAGHRDGFFRGLKDVTVGDVVQLQTTTRTLSYTIDRVQVVAPSNVSVLKDDDAPSLTLVTCYPFYFTGSAPQRYVVHASLTKDPERVNRALKRTDSEIKENEQ
jgi:sortase A